LNELYGKLINEDIAMTKAIPDGTLTRSQRRARIEELLSEIRAAENAQDQVADQQGRGGQNPVESAQRRDRLGGVIQGFDYSNASRAASRDDPLNLAPACNTNPREF
jgi:hypothetical protein